MVLKLFIVFFKLVFGVSVIVMWIFRQGGFFFFLFSFIGGFILFGYDEVGYVVGYVGFGCQEGDFYDDVRNFQRVFNDCDLEVVGRDRW